MKIKRLSALAEGAVALGLLLGASTALAEPTVILNGNNVIGIENLPVADQVGVFTVYDVEFKYDTAVNVYSSSGFNFITEEDAFSALISAQEALNNNMPIPLGASEVGTDQFFIGVEVEQNIFVGAVGAEYISGVWDDCESACIASAAVGKANDPYTWAFFTLADQ
jgi:hypothetical protein